MNVAHLRRLLQKRDSFRNVLFQTLAVGVILAERIGGVSVPMAYCIVQKIDARLAVKAQKISCEIQAPQQCLGIRVVLLCGQQKPIRGVLGNATVITTLTDHLAEPILRHMVALLCGGFKVICAVVFIAVRTVLIKQNAGEAVPGILVAKLRLLPQIIVFSLCQIFRFCRFIVGQVGFPPFIPEEASYLIRR